VHGARQSIAGERAAGNAGGDLHGQLASLLACYTRNPRPSALSPTSGREDKKRLVYMVRLARNLTSECLGGLPSNAG
jgi:hypothetical protein